MKTKIAITLGAMALGALSTTAYAVPVTPPGEEAGLDASHPLPEGAYFINIFGSGGDYLPLTDDKKSNLTFDVPVILWATPWQLDLFGHTGRFEVVAAAPIIGNVGVPYCGPACGPSATGAPGGVPPTLGGRDITGMYNPFAEAGWAFDLGGGWGFSSFNGGYAPIDNEFRLFGQDIWVYNNRSWLGWSGTLVPGGMKDGGETVKGTVALESVFGLTGNPIDHVERTRPDYWTLNGSAYVTIGKWDFGLVGFYTTDLESLPFNAAAGQCNPGATKCAQSRAGMAPCLNTILRASRCRLVTRSTCMTTIIAT